MTHSAAALDYGAGLLPGERRPAAYAASAVPSRGRLIDEPACPTRNPLQRDRDRIIHASAFRRLTYKTQMFIYHEGDHYRTRLTHSLEVAQIARTIARQLRLDEDLAEAIALSHDLGHPPFGHAGERALDRAVAACGGFDHNVQSFRIVTRLERKYHDFDGLNLTWETLEGLVKHNGPPALGDHRSDPVLMHALARFDLRMPLGLDSYASAEAQVAAISDEIAWKTHDIDDGLRAGLIDLDDLAEVPLVAPILTRERTQGDLRRVIYAITRALITIIIADAVAASRVRLGEVAPRCPDDIRNAGRPVVLFSETMAGELAHLRTFLFDHLYHHPRVLRVMSGAERIVADLVTLYLNEPGSLPETWRRDLADLDERHAMRHIADFVAGMTDRFAIAEHRRLFDATPELR
ncbi:MAG: deoxyguanosinetriphosphate triphosphohydrolase [Hyphomicrobiaceae bacterium]